MSDQAKEPGSLDASAVTRAIIAGDADAFERFYLAKFDLVLGVAMRRAGFDEQRALDVTQETFMKAIAKMKPLPSETALDAWLRRIALRTALDHLRAERRRGARERERERPEPAGSSERLESLQRALREAPGASIELLSLRHRAGLTLEAIGRTLGITAGAADGRVRRAERDLRERMEEER
jgi:RNA polymerase sigma-70 factor (ECF subfamily)